MSYRRGGGQFQGFNFSGPRHRAKSNQGSLNAVPPPSSLANRPSGNANFAPIGPRFGSRSGVGAGSVPLPSLHGSGGVGIPPPASLVNKQGYSTLNAISQISPASTSAYGVPTSRHKTEDEYVRTENISCMYHI